MDIATPRITCRACPAVFPSLEQFRQHWRAAHRPTCRRPAPAQPRRKAIKLAEVRRWYDMFGNDRTIISENGARYFKWLLDQVERGPG